MREAMTELPWRRPVARGLTTLLSRIKETSRLMVGIPDYDRYVEHVSTHHPEQPIMSYRDFFDNRQQARYGTGMKRCC
jgi:uncharacterized short protein YbdD (DUF466 family)